MISVKEAKELVLAHTVTLSSHNVPLSEAAGFTLAADVFAGVDIPAFIQSSMDGYAIRFEDHQSPLTVKGEMQAGTAVQFDLAGGQAVRIFAGAPLPAGADTVVVQEKVNVKEGILTILDEQLTLGDDVRGIGAEATAGSLAMAKGCKLTSAAIGYLAGLGKTEAEIYRSPAVAVIVTGKELQEPGKELSFGLVYESNSYSLTAALKQAKVTQINFYHADDNLDELTAILQDALQANDIVLLTGGVSVGDYDFVPQAAERLGISKIFHHVKQKPGKPLYFGKIEEKIVFGLPGNPSSVLSCFYQYVLPALEKQIDFKRNVNINHAILAQAYTKAAGLTHFLKATFDDGLVTPLNAQESFRMSSFAQANCTIELEEEQSVFPVGTEVKVYLFPE